MINNLNTQLYAKDRYDDRLSSVPTNSLDPRDFFLHTWADNVTTIESRTFWAQHFDSWSFLAVTKEALKLGLALGEMYEGTYRASKAMHDAFLKTLIGVDEYWPAHPPRAPWYQRAYDHVFSWRPS